MEDILAFSNAWHRGIDDMVIHFLVENLSDLLCCKSVIQ